MHLKLSGNFPKWRMLTTSLSSTPTFESDPKLILKLKNKRDVEAEGFSRYLEMFYGI